MKSKPSDPLEQFRRCQRLVKELEQRKARLEGREAENLKRLKEEGCRSLEEAKARLKELIAEAERKGRAAEKAWAEFTRKWPDLVEES